MKTKNNIAIIMASALAIMITLTTGCATASAGKRSGKNATTSATVVTAAHTATAATNSAPAIPPTPAAPILAATNAPAPALPLAPIFSSPPPLPSTNAAAQAITNAVADECTEDGMSGGVPCLFENTTTDDLTVVVNSAANRHKTFILRLEARTNRAFNLIPGEYTYSYIIGDDQAPRLAVGPIQKTVDEKADLYYDGAGNYHALFTLDNRFKKP